MLHMERCALLSGELVGPVQLSHASLAELRVQALACRGLCLLGRQLAQSLATCAKHQGTINTGHRVLSENLARFTVFPFTSTLLHGRLCTHCVRGSHLQKC